MTVQLHYYGSVFDLHAKTPDVFWVRYIHERVAEIEEGVADPATGFYVELDGDREAVIPYAPGDRLVLVAPVGTGGMERDIDRIRRMRSEE